MIPLIDVSQHQGAIDFVHLRNSGVEAVIIRAGNGSKRDTRVDQNMADAKLAGLQRGAYWFCNPKNSLSGAGQGRLLAQAHDIYKCELPPMWDVESYVNEAGPNPVLKGAPAARWQADFVAWCDGDSGRESIGYTGASFWNANLCPPVPSLFTDEWHADLMWLYQHDFILARYPGQHVVAGQIVDLLPRGVPPSGWEQVAMGTSKFPPPLRFANKSWDGWQWSAGGNMQGRVYGASSDHLDLNIITVQAFNRWTAQPDPPPSGDDTMNYYVVTGANAKFFGWGPMVWWTGPGTDKLTAAINVQLAAGNLTQVDLTGGPNAFINSALVPPLPTGDTLHDWTGAEFATILPTSSAVDQIARDAAAHANAGVDNIDRRLLPASEALLAASEALIT